MRTDLDWTYRQGYCAVLDGADVTVPDDVENWNGDTVPCIVGTYRNGRLAALQGVVMAIVTVEPDGSITLFREGR